MRHYTAKRGLDKKLFECEIILPIFCFTGSAPSFYLHYHVTSSVDPFVSAWIQHNRTTDTVRYHY